MPLPVQKFREAVLQILFMSEFAPDQEEIVSFMMAELKTTRREMTEAALKVKNILSYKQQLDQKIAKHSIGYSLDRISRVERAILHLGLYEMLFEEKVPSLVAIAEGIRLCRKFGTNESAQFVNAILDAVNKENAPVPEEQVLV